MAGCLLYLMLWVNEYKKVVACWFIMDALYFGPLSICMPLSLLLYLKVIVRGHK